jgi:putative protease
MQKRKTPEILAPAGDLNRLKAAVDFGANAVYIGGKSYGMRASAGNFTMEQLNEGIEYAHKNGVRVYLTINTLPRNNEIALLPEYLKELKTTGIDALIVTDIGVLSLVKEILPDIEVHISTQAGIVNYVTANAFYKMGAKRVILARELSIDEIIEIRKNTPEELEIETFVHGAMCMSFSGRCLLSSYFVNRDANRENVHNLADGNIILWKKNVLACICR